MATNVIKAPAGLGKTSMLIEKIEKLDAARFKRIEFYVPTLKLAREIEANLLARGQTVHVVLGREQAPPDGEPMCKKASLAHEVSRLGYSVFPVLCMGGRNARR